MKHNDSLGVEFYSYSAVVIGIGLLAIWLKTKGINVLLPAFLIQLVAQILITYEGIKTERYNQYVLFMGFVLPFMAAMFIGWLNTV
jgi:hypothetical protein